MKDETAGVDVEEFIGLKPNVHSFVADNSSEHNRNVVTIISHG